MKNWKVKKCKALLTMAVMLATMLPTTVFAVDVDTETGYRGEALPEGPGMAAAVVNVTPENAQYTLDGAYGSIDGKTINFTQGNYDEVLVLARPTKYEGSNTEYYNMVWTQEKGWFVEDDMPVSLDELNSRIATYKRTVEGVTFTAEEGVVLPGFSASSGHMYGRNGISVYDYVREQEIADTNGSYHAHNSLKNITFKELTISGGVFLSDYSADAVNIDITFEGCVFQGDEASMETNGFNGIKMSADSKYFSDITVTNCTFTNYYQAIYIQGVDGAVIKNNNIDGTVHNAIALQSSEDNFLKGTVEVRENFIENTQDRAIRVGNATAEFELTAENNIMVNSGDPDGELFKAESLPEGSSAVLENNYWNERTAEEAVANEAFRPEHIGITGGTFTKEVLADYCADGYSPVKKEDGTFGACAHALTEVRNAKTATCQAEGYTGDTVCTECGTVLEKGTVIAKTAHHFADGKCTVCGEADPAFEKPDDGKDEENNPGSEDNTDTGDNSNLLLWGALFAIACAALSVTLVGKKRRYHQ